VTGESSSTGSSIAVTGLTNGSTYTCVVETTIGDTTYESAAATALVPQGTDPDPGTGGAASPTSAALAFTGAPDTMRLGIVGFALVLVGAAALFVARRRRLERA
jgi:hypothetical protein